MDEELLASLVVDDPICHSSEGLDDGCHWCGAPVERCRGSVSGCDLLDESHLRPVFRDQGAGECGRGVHYATHDPDCPWWRAANVLGMDLGHHRAS